MAPSAFYTVFRQAVGPLSKEQVAACEVLVDLIAADPFMRDRRWASYALATAWHETAHTFRAIEEYGKGKKHSYGQPAGPFGLCYYGRGLVQLTWLANYERAEKELGIPFVEHPELALEIEHAYAIMSAGMREGWFSKGNTLARYFNDGITDYEEARRIINGIDKAALIAGHARMFHEALAA